MNATYHYEHAERSTLALYDLHFQKKFKLIKEKWHRNK